MQTNETINIFYATDDKQAKLALVSMVSVLENTKNKVEITIMCSTLSEENINAFYSLEKYENCKIIFVKIDEKEFKDFPLTNWVTTQTWYRVKIPDFFPKLEKAIYLDCDTLLNGDIIDFWKIDIKDYLIAGVKDIINHSKKIKEINIKDNKYFNSGVLLINCKKWREDKVFDQIKNYIKKNKKNITCADQDVINKITDGAKLALNQKFNLLEVWWKNNRYEYKKQEKIAYLEAKKNPLIIHFTGKKPTSLKSKSSYKSLWWEYAQKSSIYHQLLEDYKKESDLFHDKIFFYLNTQPFKSIWLIARKILKLTKTYKY